jgi:hypothetical protein
MSVNERFGVVMALEIVQDHIKALEQDLEEYGTDEIWEGEREDIRTDLYEANIARNWLTSKLNLLRKCE